MEGLSLVNEGLVCGRHDEKRIRYLSPDLSHGQLYVHESCNGKMEALECFEFSVLIIVLLIKPTGILGKQIQEKV